MLKLTGISDSGLSDLYFDNLTFSFYSDAEKKNNISPITNSKLDRNTIIVALGYGCKNNCTYCPQSGFKYIPVDKKKLLNEIDQLYVQSTAFHFIGGEPLNEFGIIRTIMNEYPNANSSIITNGSCLNNTIVDNLSEWRTFTTLSHDGYDQLSNRHIDPLVTKIDLIKTLSKNTNISISSILTRIKPSLKERYEFFIDTGIDFKFITINTVIPYTKQQNELTITDKQFFLNNYLNDIYSIPEEHYGCDHSLVFKMYEYLTSGYEYNKQKTYCPIFNDNVVTLNAVGDRQYCHNSQMKVDQLTMSRLRYINTDKCKNCPVLPICTSGCRIADKGQFNDICFQSFYKRICYFHFFVKKMFGFSISKIYGDFEHATDGVFSFDS